MISFSEKQREVFRIVAWVLLVLILVIFVFTRVLTFVGPFLLALVIASILNKPVDFLQSKTRLSRGKVTALVLFLFIVTVGGVLWMLISNLISETLSLSTRLLEGQDLEAIVDEFFNRLRLIYADLPVGAIQAIEDSITSAIQSFTLALRDLFGQLVNFAMTIPTLIVFTVISLVSTFFMVKDKDRILSFIAKQLPALWKDKAALVIKEMVRTVFVYVNAQLIVSSCNFVLFLIGYSLLGIEYVLIFAVFTTLFDALPVLGAGAVLGTSALFQIVMGDFLTGIGFIVIYLMVLVFRHSIEPKVIGKGVGIHPLAILFSMYVGLMVIGAIGLILGPLFLITLRALQKAGLLPAWKK